MNRFFCFIAFGVFAGLFWVALLLYKLIQGTPIQPVVDHALRRAGRVTCGQALIFSATANLFLVLLAILLWLG